jgi:hypothetical protein
MSLSAWLISPLLAVSDSSGVADFIQQISGLLILTCAAGVLWVILMAIVLQRGAERRRRVLLGMEPLAPLHVAVYRGVKKWLDPQPAPRSFAEPAAPAAAPKPRRRETLAAPDLAMLTGDLPQPDLAAMLGDAPLAEAPPARVSPRADRPAVVPPREEPVIEAVVDEPPMEIETSGDAAALLRVWRDLSDGTLILGIGGRQFRSLVDVRRANQERRFLNVLRDLNALPEATPPDAPAAPPHPADAQSAPPDAVELLRVWRDLADGTLIVEIGGQPFRALDALRRAGLDRRFLNVLRDLNALPPSAGAAPESPAATTPADPKPADKPILPGPDSAEAVSLSPGAMFRQMRRVAMGQTPAPVERKPEQTIAEQIEEILQARLADLPDYQSRSIHVRPALSGGVRIEVDGHYYDGVGDVEDAAVRDLLIEVVRAWEQSQ